MNIIIREWFLEDAAELAAILNNSKIQDNLRDGLPYPYTEQDGEAFITAMLNVPPGSAYPFAITADGVVAGSVALARQSNIHCLTAELGYYVSEIYWGRGIGTTAVQQACRYVFEHSDIVRIFAMPFATNSASCRVLEKAGFQYEGTLSANAVKKGRILDMKIYALVKSGIHILSSSGRSNGESLH